MKIEEAKEQLISLKENAKVNIDTDEIFRLDYEAITFVLNELNKKDKVIDMMAEYIEEFTGSCPNDIYDWKEIDCENVCNDPMKQCWIKYFYKKIEKIN